MCIYITYVYMFMYIYMFIFAYVHRLSAHVAPNGFWKKEKRTDRMPPFRVYIYIYTFSDKALICW